MNDESTRIRTADLLSEHRREVHQNTDRLFALLLPIEWLLAIVLALLVSPRTWSGAASTIHPHVWGAIGLGGLVIAHPIALALRRPGTAGTRHTIAIAQMLMGALLIHVTGGRIESHFHVFGSLAFLAFYRDWRVLVTATVVVAADHIVRGVLWPQSVYGVLTASPWRWLEHAAWVVFEDIFLVVACLRGQREMSAIADRHAKLEAAHDLEQALARTRERLAANDREFEIASRIQTSILPRAVATRRMSWAADSRPATQVGGDYYDVLPVSDGCFIAIGDVSGHGLNAGLMMLMVQSALAALVRQSPDASPAQLVVQLNHVLYENIRRRLGEHDFVTFSLLRAHDDGRVIFAGAHEEIVVYRGADGTCERIQTPGTWLGALADVSRFTLDTELHLGPDDVVVLYTDGVTESMNERGEQYGVERLAEVLTRSCREPVGAIRDALLRDVSAFATRQDDDVTVLVFRRDDAAVVGPQRTHSHESPAPSVAASEWSAP